MPCPSAEKHSRPEIMVDKEVAAGVDETNFRTGR
jgi:hypothetical protein